MNVLLTRLEAIGPDCSLQDYMELLHKAGAEIEETNSMYVQQGLTIRQLQIEYIVLREVIEKANKENFACNCKGGFAPVDSPCAAWCRSSEKIEVPKTKSVYPLVEWGDTHITGAPCPQCQKDTLAVVTGWFDLDDKKPWCNELCWNIDCNYHSIENDKI